MHAGRFEMHQRCAGHTSVHILCIVPMCNQCVPYHARPCVYHESEGCVGVLYMKSGNIPCILTCPCVGVLYMDRESIPCILTGMCVGWEDHRRLLRPASHHTLTDRGTITKTLADVAGSSRSRPRYGDDSMHNNWQRSSPPKHLPVHVRIRGMFSHSMYSPPWWTIHMIPSCDDPDAYQWHHGSLDRDALRSRRYM